MSGHESPLIRRSSLPRHTTGDIPDRGEQSDTRALTHPDSQTPLPADGGTVNVPRVRIKRTFHLPPEDVYTLSEIQAVEYRRTGRKPELSQLVSEAIVLWREQRAGGATGHHLLAEHPSP